MNVNFNLKNPSATESSIRMIVTHGNKVYRVAVGITIPTKGWRKKQQKCSNESVNDKLRSIKTRFEELFEPMMTDDEVKETMRMAIDPSLIEAKEDGESFNGYFSRWKSTGADATQNSRGTVYNVIMRYFGEETRWNDITPARIERFNEHLYNEGYALNTIGLIMRGLKGVMKAAYNKGYHSNDAFKFIVPVGEDTDAIYLTKAELDRLWELPLTGTMARSRDLFFLGVYTAARFSDYSKLTMANIAGGMIRYTSVKTSTPAIIPASPRLIEVLERNGGEAPRVTYQTFVLNLKKIGKLAGLDDDIVTYRTYGRKKVMKIKKKYELIGTHTARRTGATLLYQSGVPASQVMMITGHSTESNFYKYIRTTKEENAMMLKDNPFFNE